MIDTIALKEELLNQLHYKESPGFKTEILWPNGCEIPHVESAYYIQGVPIAYFSRIDTYDSSLQSEEIWELHRRVWSQSKVPLLYVITPQEIRIYNGYAESPERSKDFEVELGDEDDNSRLLRHLYKLEDIETARQEITQKLKRYRRLDLETGAFWETDDGQKIKLESRADQWLLRSMDQVKDHLLEMLPQDNKHSKDIAYALLGRSIFICYLTARGILTEDWMVSITRGRASDYLSVLNDKEITYDLFEYLSWRFNGDIFPVNEDGEEREIVNNEHLELIRLFLRGYDFDKRQLYLWPYDFRYIPIELISGIYDSFLYGNKKKINKGSAGEENEDYREKKRREIGAYYSPLPLVDFVVEETLPLETTQPNCNTKVLDPACGSGIFLVRAYQRLIEYWRQQHNYQRPKVEQLKAILEHNIFGVDIEPDAIQIAAFSLHLAILDYLTNEEVLQKNFRFSKLVGNNLITGNFLLEGVEKHFKEIEFDRVIGNPPWGENTLKDKAELRAKELHYEIGRKQIVQAFLQHAHRFCSKNSEIALLAPAKCIIHLSLSTHRRFYEKFFSEYDVRAVVDFSVLRHELFPKSKSPTVALFYRPQPPSHKKIVYGTPKPSPLSSHLGAIILDATEVKYLDRSEVLGYPFIWKVASWGIARDVSLIKRLKFSFSPLKDLEASDSLQWKISKGFFVSKEGKKQDVDWLTGKPLVEAKQFREYYVRPNTQVKEKSFERSRLPEVYIAPLVLIRKSKCKAAFFDTKSGFIAYPDTISGISGSQEQEYLLKWLVAYINSPLARYYHFLTSSLWGVERDLILHDEIKEMPFFVPPKDHPYLQEVLQYVDKILALYKQHDSQPIKNIKKQVDEYENRIAQLVFDLYELTETERQQVRDLLEYEVKFFHWSTQKSPRLKIDALKPLDAERRIIVEYAGTFIDTAKTLLQNRDQTLNATAYQDGTPLNVVEFRLTSLKEVQPVQVKRQSKDVEETLQRLDRLLLEQSTSTLYARRHVRIFDGPSLYMIRPNERRFWTHSQALEDADTFIAELLVLSKRAIMGAPR
ncbi:MAG TPA: N-6 DNA methylase [Candidatus Nitrosopolaris rasttigaisensis]|nr:N-6 DNA methylase [Candidatus Nitrosopolaris rasttigaisensis]